MAVEQIVSKNENDTPISKDLSRVKGGFKSVPTQFYCEFARLSSAKKWWEIQNMVEEERF